MSPPYRVNSIPALSQLNWAYTRCVDFLHRIAEESQAEFYTDSIGDLPESSDEGGVRILTFIDKDEWELLGYQGTK